MLPVSAKPANGNLTGRVRRRHFPAADDAGAFGRGGMRAARMLLLLALCLLAPAGALETSGLFMTKLERISRSSTKRSNVHAIEPSFLGYYQSKFAFTPRGRFSASFIIRTQSTVMSKSAAAACFRLVLCDVTSRVVRDSSYQMKRVFLLEDPNWRRNMAKNMCVGNPAGTSRRKLKCFSETLTPRKKVRFEVAKKFGGGKNRIILINLIRCNDCLKNPKDVVDVDIHYDVNMVNVGSRFEHLGWEEKAYPYATTAITTLAVGVFSVVVLAAILSLRGGHSVHFVLKVLLCTSAVKIISSSLTAAAFWRVALTGKLMAWFFVLRVPLIIIDELLIGLLMLVMSTGIGMMPTSWMFDRRSSTFAIFLGLALELFTVVTSEVVFAYKYLGLIVFLFSGGTVAFIGILFSWKNIRFIAKYVKLVRMANIFVETTPLLRMGLFFNVNASLVLALWLFKIVTFGVMDHVMFRPDLLWTCFEASDMILLIFYAFAVFPRKKSAFYVDMSHVDNVRLREVNAWHVRRAQREEEPESSTNVDDETTFVGAALRADAGTTGGTTGSVRHSTSVDSGGRQTRSMADSNADDPEPPWVTWESGMVLPVPTTGMWNVNEDVRRVLKRHRPPPVTETQVRVLGSPMESPESLALTIAKPIIGPDAPRQPDTGGFPPVGGRQDRDDDGGDVRGTRVRGRESASRRVGDEEMGMEILPTDGDLGGDRNNSAPSRRRVPSFVEYADSEMFSVPSSNASADGEVFSNLSSRPRKRQ